MGGTNRPILRVGDREISENQSPFVVAELSANHNGSLENAFATIDAAASAGADAVKLQTYKPESLTLDADGPHFAIESGPWAGRRLHELYEEAATPYEWHEALFERIRSQKMVAFSSPFDAEGVELLERCGCPAYKVASAEVIDLELLKAIAAAKKPVILSTGMATLEETDQAVETLRSAGAPAVAVLHCVSGYPALPEEMQLATIRLLADRYQAPGGLSDHTTGTAVSIAAAALGASIIEKHVTLRRAAGGVDSGFSLEPSELSELVRGAHAAWASVSSPPSEEPAPSEATTLPFRRSLWVVADVPAGEPLTTESVRALRPAAGLHPRELPSVLGRPAARALRRGEPLTADAVIR